MKKLFIHAGIGLVLLVLLNQLAIRTAAVYKDGASIVCEKKREAVRQNQWDIPNNKENVLFFGASGILSAVIPHVFDSVMDQKTYSLNLALPALPIGSYYHCLLDYLESNPPPENIIMAYHVESNPILLFDTYANQGIDYPDEVLSYFFNRADKNQTVNYLLPMHVYRTSIFKYLYNSLADPDNIEQRRQANQRIIQKMLKDRGYYLIMEQSRFPEGRLPDDFKAKSDCPDCEMKMYDPDSDVYVEKFFRLTQKHNINVFLVSYPVREGAYKQFDAVPDPIRKLDARYPNISLPGEGWKIPFYENKYFSDPHHLNYMGAEKYTRKVATMFKETYFSDSLVSAGW